MASTRGVLVGAGAAVLGVALAGLIWWDSQLPARGVTAIAVPDLRDAGRIAEGARIYAAHCAACHGAELQGQPNWTERLANGRLPAPPHDDTGHTWHHPNAMLFAVTRDGMKPPYAPPGYESDMPAFGGVLSDDQIWNVLAFIQSRWSPAVRERHAQIERASHRH